MNAGLGSLMNVKTGVLPEATRARDSWDEPLLQIAQGVASLFDRYCNRTLARTVDAVYETPGGVYAISLPAYPVEGDIVVETRRAGETTWEDISESIEQVFPHSGLVEFSSIIGTRRDLLRVTYTGGFWFSTAEPGDAGQVMPDGAKALPVAVQSAWHLQIQAVLERNGILKKGAVKSDEDIDKLELMELDLVKQVKRTLDTFIRHGL